MGGKSSSNDSSQASKEAVQLGRDQWDYQRGLIEKYTPLYEQQMQASLDAQTKNTERSDAMWQQYQDYFAPATQQLATTAMDYNTQERRDKAAADAAAGVSSQFDTARQQLAEQMANQNVSGSSGAGLATAAALAIQEAKAKAGAEATARQGVEQTGIGLLGQVANVGNGLSASGLQTGQAGLQAGSGATGQVAGLSGLSANGLNASMGAYNTGINGLNAAAQNQNSMFGDMLGAGASVAGMFMSDENVKDMGEEVDGKRAQGLVEASPSYEWSYKEGEGDGNGKPRIGPTAQSLSGTEVSDGHAIDGISMLGLHHSALGETIKDVKALTKEVRGLSAAITKDKRKSAKKEA